MDSFIVGVILSVVFCVLIVAVKGAGNIGKPKIAYPRLLEAISIVEANDNNNSLVDQDALGTFHLRKEYVDEANRILAKNDLSKASFTYDQRLDKDHSETMITVYWSEHAKQPFSGFLQVEDLVAIHRAGPKGHKKYWSGEDNQLQTYVAKVKEQYDKLG